MSYPGGPLVAAEFSGRGVGSREGLWSSTERSKVMAYSSPSGVSVSRVGRQAVRPAGGCLGRMGAGGLKEEGGQEGGG